jgi:hypothetical protein
VILGFFLLRTLNQASGTLRNWGVIISAFALGIASVNLIQSTLGR